MEADRSLIFLNSNVHIQGNTTLFRIEAGAWLEFSDLDTVEKLSRNTLSAKQGPAIQIHTGGGLFVCTSSNITSDQGPAIQSSGDGFINLYDTVVHGKPAVISQDREILGFCELFGPIQAPGVEAELTLFHHNPEIVQDVYHLTYQSITSDTHAAVSYTHLGSGLANVYPLPHTVSIR